MSDPTDLGAEPDGATPLSPDDLVGLIPNWVSNRGELNSVEHENIVEAMHWAFGKERTIDTLLSEEFIRELHGRMFRDVWKWAGKPRQRETNIGVAPSQISVQLRNLLLDTKGRIVFAADVSEVADEIAVWFHHRLAQIHPFPNGNGRHARLAADLLVMTLGGNRFTWGGADLSGACDARSEYLSALREADADFDYEPLLEFARS